MGAWLKDSQGNDVFDSVNNPASGKPIFDPIDVSKTLGSNPVTNAVDTADQGLRNLAETHPADMAADSGSRAFARVSSGNTAINNAADRFSGDDRNGDGNPDPPVGLRTIVLAVAAVALLYLLRPLFEIAANATEGGT